MARTGPGVLDALSLLAEVSDELVVRTVRDTHVAWLDRFGGGRVHRGIAGGVYAGLGAGLRATSRGLGSVAERRPGPALDADPRGRFLTAAVNGLIGDRLARERPRMAIPMAVRVDGRDVEPDEAGLAAFPEPTGQLVVLLHGLCESDTAWNLHRERRGTTYAESLAARGWSPVVLRANTGLPLRENGVALASLLERVVEGWPVPVTRIALVGHSMGGLVMRAAAAVVGEQQRPPAWTPLVSDVVTLGTPHLGAPLAAQVATGSVTLGRLPESAAFGRILDWRSTGVRDLVLGLAEDVPALPHARYRLVAATLTRSQRHPVGARTGDLLVRPASAYGRARGGRSLFPDADVLHVGRADHFALLNHPRVEEALLDWLA